MKITHTDGTVPIGRRPLVDVSEIVAYVERMRETGDVKAVEIEGYNAKETGSIKRQLVARGYSCSRYKKGEDSYNVVVMV